MFCFEVWNYCMCNDLKKNTESYTCIPNITIFKCNYIFIVIILITTSWNNIMLLDGFNIYFHN